MGVGRRRVRVRWAICNGESEAGGKVSSLAEVWPQSWAFIGRSKEPAPFSGGPLARMAGVLQGLGTMAHGDCGSWLCARDGHEEWAS